MAFSFLQNTGEGGGGFGNGKTREQIIAEAGEKRQTVASKQLESVALELTPVVGNAKLVSDAVVGKNVVTGEQLSNKERVVNGLVGGAGLLLDAVPAAGEGAELAKDALVLARGGEKALVEGKSIGLMERGAARLAGKESPKAKKASRFLFKTAHFLKRHPELVQRAEKALDKKLQKKIQKYTKGTPEEWDKNKPGKGSGSRLVDSALQSSLPGDLLAKKDQIKDAFKGPPVKPDNYAQKIGHRLKQLRALEEIAKEVPGLKKYLDSTQAGHNEQSSRYAPLEKIGAGLRAADALAYQNPQALVESVADMLMQKSEVRLAIREGLNELFWLQVGAIIPSFGATYVTLHLYIVSPRFLAWIINKLNSLLQNLPAIGSVIKSITDKGIQVDPGKVIAHIVRKVKIPRWHIAAVLITDMALFVVILCVLILMLVAFCNIPGIQTAGEVAAYFTGESGYKICSELSMEKIVSKVGLSGNGVGNGGNNGGPVNLGQWKEPINKAAAQYGLDPCVLNTIVQMESSGGSASSIGHDHTSPPPPITKWNRSMGASRKAREGNTHDPFQANNAPLYGIDWQFSHGIGLTQATIFPFKPGTWIDANTPSRKENGKWYKVSDLLDPNVSIDFTAGYVKARGGDAGNPRDAFKKYNGNGPDAETYADIAMKKYEQCKLTTQ